MLYQIVLFAAILQPNLASAIQSEDLDNGNTEKDGDGSELLNGFLLRVPLPITGDVDTRLRATIEKAIESFPAENVSKKRPLIILEFANQNGESGEGSEIERCAALARFLSSKQLSQVKTVAYLPASNARFNQEDSDNQEKLTYLKGHAVLVAAACEEIVMDEATAIGGAGSGEPSIEDYHRAIYQSIASKTRVLRPEIVNALLDPELSLHRVVVDSKVYYANDQELAELESKGNVVSRPIAAAGSFPVLKSQDLLEYRLIRKRISSRSELADALNVRPEVLRGNPTIGGGWKPLHIKLTGELDERSATWILTALEKKLLGGSVNLLFFEIDCDDAQARDALRLAQRISELDPVETRTVAFVPRAARSYAGVIALCCDQLFCGDEAIIGGPALQLQRRRRRFQFDDSDSVKLTIREIAQAKGIDWSVLSAITDEGVSVRRWKHPRKGTARFFCEEERLGAKR